MRQSFFLITLYFLGLTLGFTSCQEVPNDGLPSYIKINQVSFFNEDGVIDTLNGIYDVWVQVEGDDRGAIGWPNTIAVLTEGEKLILLEPGIYKNGDFLQREVYPFYDIVQIDTAHLLCTTPSSSIQPLRMHKVSNSACERPSKFQTTSATLMRKVLLYHYLVKPALFI